jgi:hypothetical protein
MTPPRISPRGLALRLLAIAGLVLLPACAEEPATGPALAEPATPQQASFMCPDICLPIGDVHDGGGVGSVVVVPGDPSPGAPGIWLGNAYSAQSCYADYNYPITDSDHDWLDDECEFQLARAFAPAMAISPGDYCPGGEPYWTAKYFDNQQPYNWGAFVRIGYMPGYYQDCGALGHAGDSEFMMLAVKYNTTTRHWEAWEAYMSAHEGTFNAASDYTPNPSRLLLEFPTRSLAYPRVWIARGKHGFYRTRNECDTRALFNDTCPDNVVMGRMRVYRFRNAGSAFVDNFPAGVLSDDLDLRNLVGRREYFYNSHAFGGWQPAASGVTPYATMLGGYFFEKYDYSYAFTGGTWYLGPGYNGGPTSTYFTTVFDGPSTVTAYQNATWTSFATGGTLPLRAEWWRKYTSQPAATLVGTSTGSGTSVGSFTGATDRCENFSLTLKAYSALNTLATRTENVTVTCAPPPPPVQLTLTIVQGNNQTAAVATALPVAPTVKVTNSSGQAVSGVTITFAITSGGMALSQATVVTGAAGTAATSWTLGYAAGTNKLTATAAPAGTIGNPATFTATSVAGPANYMYIAAGNNQSGPISTVLPISPSVRLVDVYSNPVAGRTVNFAISSGGGTVLPLSVTSGTDGRATVSKWILGPAVGANTLTATSAGLPPGSLVFTADGLPAGTLVPPTAFLAKSCKLSTVSGKVYVTYGTSWTVALNNPSGTTSEIGVASNSNPANAAIIWPGLTGASHDLGPYLTGPTNTSGRYFWVRHRNGSSTSAWAALDLFPMTFTGGCAL